jgi:hypothetical protein
VKSATHTRVHDLDPFSIGSSASLKVPARISLTTPRNSPGNAAGERWSEDGSKAIVKFREMLSTDLRAPFRDFGIWPKEKTLYGDDASQVSILLVSGVLRKLCENPRGHILPKPLSDSRFSLSRGTFRRWSRRPAQSNLYKYDLNPTMQRGLG